VPKKERLKKAANGLYFRNLGYRKTQKGYSQPKFYLGRDQRQAGIANLMLEQLWAAVKRRWEAQMLQKAQVKDTEANAADTSLVPIAAVPGSAAIVTVGVPEVEYVRDGKPVWDSAALCVAEAIRNGEAVAQVPLPEQLASYDLQSASVGYWLDGLRRDFCDVPVRIELLEPDKQAEAEQEIRLRGTELIEEGRRMVRQRAGGERLHTAFKEYEEHLERKHTGLDGRVTPTGTTQVRQSGFLRDTFPNCDLAELDTARILMFLDTLAMRPRGQKVERIAARTARNYIKQFRHFLRWLNTAPGFKWKRPSDLDIGTVRIQETPEEKSRAAHKSRVQTYTTEEIGVLWRFATPFRRLLLLLGLNCGFDAKMIATLQPKDVLLHQKHPHEEEVGQSTSPEDSWIMRLRNKSSVYGEWKLWPVTVQALEWWQRQREQIEVVEGVTAYIVNQSGKAYDTPTAANDRGVQIPNMWRGLTETVRKDEAHKNFRRLSFGKLRKTAGNLIRRASSGELAGIFLCHGTPVSSDALLDFYTNRPFAKVFDAIDAVSEQLTHIWSTVEDPFLAVRKKGGSNISAGKIRRIQRMRKAGYKVKYIAEKLKVSPQTVSRHSSRRNKN